MSSVGRKSEKIYAHLYLRKDLHDAIQNGRRDKKRYDGRLFSNGLAFELGADILLGVAENEEDVLKQKLEDIEIHQNSINSQRYIIREQLEKFEAKKKSIQDQGIKERQDVELLASKIIDLWDSIVLYKNTKNIDFIVRHFEGKLIWDKVASMFPLKYEPAPSSETAFQIAASLLEYEGDGWNV
jgi:hypothetical protein